MSGVLSTIEGVAHTVQTKAMGLVDGVFPPERRQELLTKIQQFAVKNPKLSAFLLTNIALTGPPMFLFILFTLTVFIFALVAALLVGLLVAIGFTLFAVIVALVILFPTVFFTTLAACFFFLWGLGGYYLLKWFNKGDTPAPEGSAIGDQINALTGGRLDFLMSNARKEYPDSSTNGTADNKTNGTADNKTNGDENGGKREGQQQNGKPKQSPPKISGADVGKHADTFKKNANVGNGVNKVNKSANVDGVTKTAGVDGVTKNAGVDGVKSKADSATGTVKGVTGSTGLV